MPLAIIQLQWEDKHLPTEVTQPQWEDKYLPAAKTQQQWENIQMLPDNFKLTLPTTQATFFYTPSEIIRLEGESNYTKFFFTGGKTLLTSRTLKEYEEILEGHGFIRIHKSHMVNKAHVVNYSGDGLLTLTDNSKVEISRRRREEVTLQLKSL